jgi:hypothetical protein
MDAITGVQEGPAVPQVGHRPIPGWRVSPHVEQRMVSGLGLEVRSSHLNPYGTRVDKIHGNH